MKKIKELDNWEWSTLVASWRYYEYRMTIASATFPADIIGRFWRSGRYSDEVLTTIARQFADVDHGLRGEEDWMVGLNSTGLMDMDKRPWCKFHAFCHAWIHGFTEAVLSDGKKYRLFYSKYTRRWYPADAYIKWPSHETWIDEKDFEERK